jgi:hypothetical protein
MDAMLPKPGQRRPCRFCDGEVDDYVALGVSKVLQPVRDDHVVDLFTGAATIDRSYQREVGIGRNRSTHRPPHLTHCSVNTDTHVPIIADCEKNDGSTSFGAFFPQLEPLSTTPPKRPERAPPGALTP